jgi:hypothetical protein
LKLAEARLGIQPFDGLSVATGAFSILKLKEMSGD